MLCGCGGDGCGGWGECGWDGGARDSCCWCWGNRIEDCWEIEVMDVSACQNCDCCDDDNETAFA